MKQHACAVLVLLSAVGCGHALPTAPSAVLADTRFTSDPRYDAGFYASFATRVQSRPKTLTVYISTMDHLKQPIPVETLEQVRDAVVSLQTVLGLPIDVRNMDTAKPIDVINGISILFQATAPGSTNVGGFVHQFLQGMATINYQAITFDACGGIAKTVVRHEILHAMGFDHTDHPHELMFPEVRYCDRLPSPRELFHIRAAYQLPLP